MSDRSESSKRCFVDTNIWLYAFIASDNGSKRDIARAVVGSREIVISTQVINETYVNLLKKALLPEARIRELVAAFYERYAVTEVGRDALLMSSELREKHSLSYWDSLIVASALGTKCDILYTEDMQDGLEVEGRLVIANPFTSK